MKEDQHSTCRCDPNNLKSKQQAIHMAESFADYLAKRASA